MQAVLDQNAITSSLHEKDFYAWAMEQASHLESGNIRSLDINNLVEELQDMGKREKRELRSRLRVLLMHLLKWQFQPDHRSTSWQATITTQREEIKDVLDDSPSLRPLVEQFAADVFSASVLSAAAETTLPTSAFPVENPYSTDQILSPDFWPEAKETEFSRPKYS